MPEAAEVWNEVLPGIMQEVTGVGVWTALKASVPIVQEGGVFVLGLPPQDSELAGHLRIPASRRAIETAVGAKTNQKVDLRVINGTDLTDWETEKRRDEERRRLQDKAIERQKVEIAAGKSWDQIYDQLTRSYSALSNRSMPQVRAKYLLEAVEIVSSALSEMPINDDLAERNFARCLERIAQYSDVPSTIVALRVLEKAFSG